jgi:hypothetical protein
MLSGRTLEFIPDFALPAQWGSKLMARSVRRPLAPYAVCVLHGSSCCRRMVCSGWQKRSR